MRFFDGFETDFLTVKALFPAAFFRSEKKSAAPFAEQRSVYGIQLVLQLRTLDHSP